MIVYVAHRGDEVVAIGTHEEVAERLGIKPQSIYSLSSENAKRKWLESRGRRLVVDRVEVTA